MGLVAIAAWLVWLMLPERVRALPGFRSAVDTRDLPNESETAKIMPDELEAFLSALDG